MKEQHQKITCLISGLLIMLCVGILYMWSVFQPYVVSEKGWNPGDVAMTSALMIACFVLGNILGGLVQQKVKPRIICIVGSAMFALGMYLTSLLPASSPRLIYLTYSLISGLGCGFVYCTVLYALQKWFAAQTGLITGLTVSCFGLSVVILSPIAEKMLATLGVSETFRIFALIFLVVCVLCSLGITQPDPKYYMHEAQKVLRADEFKQFTPKEMVKTPLYYFLVFSMFLSSAAYLVIIPYIKTIATERSMSTGMALAAVMCTGIASALGRILAPTISDRFGRTNSIIGCCVISALACLLMIPATGPLYILAVFLIAFTYGGTSGINPVISTELFGAANSGTNYGLVMVSIAASSVVFGKVASIVGGTGSFTPVLILSAVVSVIPMILMRGMHNFCMSHGGKNI